jgi:sporulation protein YlmC with PRC-barrel domain
VLEVSDMASKFVPAQRFVGMQVIDSKGMLVGNVKDVSVNFHDRNMAFLVATKSHAELDVAWDDVSSVEDVVLLKKDMELPKLQSESASPAPSVVQAVVICPNCGASAPGVAKFCPKCGRNLK